ncbi:MAG: DNA translocase FtsK [bacterium]
MKNKLNNSPIGYEIPQMEDNEVGLRTFDNKFKGTSFIAPVLGRDTVDITVASKDALQNDIDNTYDAFRSEKEKKITDQELLQKHGTIYPEFEGVNDQNIRPKEVVVEKEVPSYEPVVTTPDVAFENITFSAPKEDYSSKETTLPPFFFSKPVEPKVEEQTSKPVYEEVTPQQTYTQPQPTYVQPQTYKEPTSQVQFKDKIRRPYVYPSLNLFDKPMKQEQDDPSFLLENKETINQTFDEFNIKGEVENYTYGPSVTRYEVKLAPGVNVKKVLGIVDTIKMNLGAKTLRVEAPIPGKKHVGIEVPNRKAQMVHYYDIINNNEFKESRKPLLIALGRDIDGNSVYNSIEEMPHGLIAGATASGKSVCINTLLISLLMKNSPEELRLILVDPKMVELASYDNIPHLVTPVITDSTLAVPALKWSVDEMERRYEILKSTGCRNIAEYNAHIKGNLNAEKLPFIVIVIDEFGDLSVGGAAAELDEPIKRIAQKARAAGMHLILATQRPSTDVIRGTIKANIPGRIAFRVSQTVDSQTIIDSPGAENLLGKGDMLVKGVEGLMRVQGAYIGGRDIENVTSFIRENNDCEYIFTHEDLKKPEQSTSKDSGNGEDLELLHSAATFFINNGSCSINALQNKFGIGFNRAQRVVQQLSNMGIVGEKAGTTQREVNVTQSQLDEMFNKNN